MKKVKIQKVEIDKYITEEIFCDKCGRSCRVSVDGFDFFNYLELRADWGYTSGKDMETWTAEICEQCTDELSKVINFDIRPTELKGALYQ